MPSRATLDKKRRDVAAMFDGVATRYDLMNDLLSVGMDRRWRHAVTEAVDPRPGQVVLDLAAGTGTSAQPLADRGARVFPTDLSAGMLQEGAKRYPSLQFVQADALALPYRDDAFDAVTISFGLRNFEDTLAGLSEMRRVTRPGGRVVICEFSTPTSAALRASYHWYMANVMTPMARLGSNPVSYQYLIESILDWPDQAGLADLMQQAGWRQIAWRNLTGGIVALHRAVA